jgi:hypothetical protein
MYRGTGSVISMRCLMDRGGDGVEIEWRWKPRVWREELCARGGTGKARISRALRHHMTSKRNSRIDRASVTTPVKRCKINDLTFNVFKRVYMQMRKAGKRNISWPALDD